MSNLYGYGKRQCHLSKALKVEHPSILEMYPRRELKQEITEPSSAVKNCNELQKGIQKLPASRSREIVKRDELLPVFKLTAEPSRQIFDRQGVQRQKGEGFNGEEKVRRRASHPQIDFPLRRYGIEGAVHLDAVEVKTVVAQPKGSTIHPLRIPSGRKQRPVGPRAGSYPKLGHALAKSSPQHLVIYYTLYKFYLLSSSLTMAQAFIYGRCG